MTALRTVQRTLVAAAMNDSFWPKAAECAEWLPRAEADSRAAIGAKP